MGTNYIAPIWRMPRNANNTPVDKLSNYSIDFISGNSARYIDCGTNLFTGSNITSISISCWVKTTASTSSMVIVSKDLANQGGTGLKNRNFLFQLVNDTVYWQTSSDGNNLSQTVVNSSGVTNGEWHHIVVTYEAGATSGTAEKKIYIDGQLRATDSAATIPNMYNNTTVPIEIGRRGDNARYYSGEISQVSIFDYALDLNKVDYLYNLNNPMAITGGEPVAYWPLGDNSNPNTNAGYPNISVGADSVFDFQSLNYIETAHIDNSGAMSVSGWFKTTASGYNVIYNEDEGIRPSGSNRNYYFSVRNTSVRFLKFFETGGVVNTIASGLTVSDGNWHHAVAIWDGTTNTNGIKIFVDGILRAQETAPDTVAKNLNIAGRIGGSTSTYNFVGELSNVQVWNTSLTFGSASSLGDTAGGEVAELYNNGQPLMTGTQPQEANLKAWYKLNQSANYDQGIGPFKIEKVGSPDHSVANNGCFTTGGVLRWQDTNNQVLSDGDYFTYYSPLIRCNSNDVDLVTTGGSYQTGISSGLEYSLEYSVDGGSWVVWKAQTVATNQSLQNWTVANVNNLNCNQSIQVRLRAVGGLFGTEQFNFNDVRINVSGVQTYFETFATAGLGWSNFGSGAVYNPPTDNYVDPSWQIPDNRSAYPQSFDFDSGHISLPSTNLSITGALTISAWVKTTSSTYQSVLIKGNSVSAADYYFRIQDTGLIRLRFGNTNYGIGTTSVKDGNWHHICVVYVPSTSVTYYVDGEQDSQTTSSIPAAITNSYTNVGIGEIQQFIGQISNVQVFNTALPATGTDSVETLYNNGVPLTTAIATDNLKAWYKLDNNELFDGTNWSVENQKYPASYESALDFPGTTSDKITLNTFSIDTTQPYTISAWVNLDSTTNQTIISGNASGGSNDFTVPFGIRSVSGSFAALVSFQENSSSIYRQGSNIAKNELTNGWHHVMLVKDGVDCTFYYDGQPNGTSSFSTTPPATINLTTIGKGFNNFMLNGRLSNLAIWQSDQSININNIYNNGTPQNSYTETPISWWKLNNTTTGIRDSVGSNNGTISGNITKANTFVSTQAGISSGMTGQNLVNNNVSVLNGESEGMNSTNLVQSNLTRKVPFSNYSTKFDGIDYYTDTGGGFLNGATTASISVWMNMATLTSAQQSPVISNWGTAPQRQLLIRHVNSATDGFQFYIYGPSREAGVDFVLAETQDSITASANTWYNIVGTWDGSEIKIYVNGALGGSETAISGSLSSSTAPNLIGRYNTTYMNGNISNAAFWTDTVLSEDDILNIYNNGVTQDLSNFRVQPTNWFPLGESYTYYNGSVMVARDVIGGGEVDGVNIVQSDIAGNAPGSDASGTGSNLAIADLKGNMYNSDKNAYSINMADYADGVTNPANSGRSTDTP